MEAALHSLSELGMDYIDLYLIHWPGTQGVAVDDPCNPGEHDGEGFKYGETRLWKENTLNMLPNV